jgi:hypothetical protein
MILELAVKAGCEFIITYNVRDFAGVEQFGIQVVDLEHFYNALEHYHEYTECTNS